MTGYLEVGYSSGFLTVVGGVFNEGRYRYVRVRCACGVERRMRTDWLRGQRVKSCGCKKAQLCKSASTTHGMSDEPEYLAWFDMRARCSNPKDSQFINYGARGISVCPQWESSFESFFMDLGSRPSSNHSLERRDNNGNYEPGNCYWATPKEQVRNRRITLFVDHQGERKKFADLSDSYSLPYHILWQRVFRYGMSLESALAKPYRRSGEHA